MEIRGLPFREYMALLNLIIYWDLMEYNDKERKKESNESESVI